MTRSARPRPPLTALVAFGLLGALGFLGPSAGAQPEPHPYSHHPAPAATGDLAPMDLEHGSHTHGVGPAGRTYDLRWIDGMVQHHTGALRMSEFVFNIGEPGVGSLARDIWRDQAQEIRAMGQWRKAWYPEAPVYPVALRPGGDPDAIGDLVPMGAAGIAAMQMMGSPPTRANRVTWFLEGMLHHHGGALSMAHDALRHSDNPTIRRFARNVIVAQRREILQLRRMLQHDGLNKPDYYRYDRLFDL